ncbi:hypothetical protein CYMTET_23456 [Cymbomonas tetramitiformis]|uniref:Glycosyltransferase family 28 N-terminal domain-containing protein n=1 Tax=Cymbomonas tetramitiformis TaxID=36881 RepID=A0AAE0FXT7_9CHLO|nr:hypothetical protein CYMTET_23456 [Cymbomonas tetramitiformis]
MGCGASSCSSNNNLKELSDLEESLSSPDLLEGSENLIYADGDDDNDFMNGLEFKESLLPVPSLCVAVLVVGTHGDVLPFVQLGQELQKGGHRVRLATHSMYREMVVTAGLEFYPLGGDPKVLSGYCVQSGGRLIPLDVKTLKQVPAQREQLKAIIESTLPACTKPDPEDASKRPFVADAIISNPPVYSHVHIAQGLGIPLHMMFPQPWTRTCAFPHPFANQPYDGKWTQGNRRSYFQADVLQHLGVLQYLNSVRQRLKLPTLSATDLSAAQLLNINHVPFTKMWSPAICPKVKDWGPNIDVVGNFFTNAASSYTPPPEFAQFLSVEPAPIFIGFGSMVIKDTSRLTKIIAEASMTTNTRVVLQSSWSKLGGGDLPDSIFCLGNCPHDWLFPQMAATIHHGGAGTTAAGLRAGLPTMICPFFGDQHFWGFVVERAKCGPPPCEIQKLDANRLKASFLQLRSKEMRAAARQMAEAFALENGVFEGARSFHKQLPVEDIICDVSLFTEKPRIARWYCASLGLKMSAFVYNALCKKGLGRKLQAVPYWPVDYKTKFKKHSRQEQELMQRQIVSRTLLRGVQWGHGHAHMQLKRPDEVFRYTESDLSTISDAATLAISVRQLFTKHDKNSNLILEEDEMIECYHEVYEEEHGSQLGREKCRWIVRCLLDATETGVANFQEFCLIYKLFTENRLDELSSKSDVKSVLNHLQQSRNSTQMIDSILTADDSLFASGGVELIPESKKTIS